MSDEERKRIIKAVAWGLYEEALGVSIVDGRGKILARLAHEDGEGVITADVVPGRLEPSEQIPDRFWIPDLPGLIRFAWTYQNAHGRRYYQRANAKGRLTTSPGI